MYKLSKYIYVYIKHLGNICHKLLVNVLHKHNRNLCDTLFLYYMLPQYARR